MRADVASSHPRRAPALMFTRRFVLLTLPNTITLANTYHVFREGNTIELDLSNTKLFNSAIINGWLPWLAGCPAHWLADGWLESICIIAVTSRYGQNRRICTAATEELEARQWLEERQWEHIRFITIAIATDITCVLHVTGFLG